MCSRLLTRFPLSEISSKFSKSASCYCPARWHSSGGTALRVGNTIVTSNSDDLTATVDDGEHIIKVDRRSKFAFYLDSDVRNDIENGLYKPSKHPGLRKMKVSNLPDKLTKAIDILLEGYNVNDLQKEADQLTNRIWDRQGPMEENLKQEKIQKILSDVVSKEEVDPLHPAVQEADRKQLLKAREQLFNRQMRAEIFNYKPLDFTTEKSCLVYLQSRLCGDYSALLKVFNELRIALPHFRPKSMLDFGSGVGSATWAVDQIWPRKCREVFNVDISGEMNLLNEKLLRGGTIDGAHSDRPDTTFFRQFLPASGTIKHDLVVASRSLFELPSHEMRLRTLDILYKTVSPGGCLVLIEVGNPRGCEYILEAREFVLEGIDANKSYNRAKVVAPCPHQFSCPLNRKQKKYRICSDCVRYEGFNKAQQYLDIFSYIIIQKPLQNLPDEEIVQHHWPRVVQPVLRPSGQSIVRVCNQYGQLQELTVCRGKHNMFCHRVGKATELGDLLPVTLLPPELHLKPAESVFEVTKKERRSKKISSSQEDET